MHGHSAKNMAQIMKTVNFQEICGSHNDSKATGILNLMNDALPYIKL